MKTINNISAAIVFCLFLSGCDNNDANHPANLSLLANEWQTISQRIVMQDGSTHLLLCETEKFRNDGKWIMSYTGMSGNTIKDSCVYQLQPDNETIKFYGYENGVLSPTANISKIKVLNKHLLVYHCLRADGSTWIIDSLGR